MLSNMQKTYRYATLFLLLTCLLNLFLGIVGLLFGSSPVGVFNLIVAALCLLVWYSLYWKARATWRKSNARG